MRGDIVYRIFGVHEGRKEDCYFGAFRTLPEAMTRIAQLQSKEVNGGNWAQQYHNRGFVIHETVVETDFEIPPQPKPRDRYFVRGTPKKNQPGTWDSTVVEVFRRVCNGTGAEKVCDYERNYSLLGTFEPFRQNGRDYALIARHYTGTSVLDLDTGVVIAEEPVSPHGFCPVGFYVPDWWDVHDGSIIPGSQYWSDEHEWPCGQFGFVWGCVWGDDSSWKIQLLDLSAIRSGVIQRAERFGYVELSPVGFQSPCFTPDVSPPTTGSTPPPFIRLARGKDKVTVTLAVEMRFDFDSGQPSEWQRLKIADFE